MPSEQIGECTELQFDALAQKAQHKAAHPIDDIRLRMMQTALLPYTAP